MHRIRNLFLLALCTLVIVLGCALVPILSRHGAVSATTVFMGQPPTPEATEGLMAARGCSGANSAKDALKSAENYLREVRRESRELEQAWDSTRQALTAVNRHLSRYRC
ncbi:hypothetical protein DO97_11775 [Neosynechococcus sphagnicola sy1]|uniref:Uncharacterized protein n=1 Tax=Neosynechococcus sphagnicola sy1 TaxID=1497020 RepID=A0A098TJZ8_9CYAN|nr:hypothetical protein [Neosynechococcus sphagnicola]KGF72167.1 hypothetical protein DO97_11775 [Neosynechococcus sphagnicola sy1]